MFGRLRLTLALSPKVAKRLIQLSSRAGHKDWSQTLQATLAVYEMCMNNALDGYNRIAFTNADGATRLVVLN